MKYRVKRQHYGKHEYFEGDERELSPNEARPLIDMGVLEEIKQAPTPENKMREAPKNKGEKLRKKSDSD